MAKDTPTPNVLQDAVAAELPNGLQPQRPQSQLPLVSRDRMKASLEEGGSDDADVQTGVDLKSIRTGAANLSSTVLYLAYGSNLCKKTFEGMRKIKPLARVNIIAPQLELVMDIPGMPYMEPAFANVRHRDTGSSNALDADETQALLDDSGRIWDDGLIGVVYEITKEDFARIIATEGGGASYKDIIVPCHALDDTTDRVRLMQGKPALKAHTLIFPQELVNQNRRGVEASARYLGLLKTGAEENNLPAVYKGYLASFRPYTPTTTGQKVGGIVLRMTLWPTLMVVFAIGRFTKDKDGTHARPVQWFITKVFRRVWTLYDWVLKPVFGDGEKTIRSNV